MQTNLAHEGYRRWSGPGGLGVAMGLLFLQLGMSPAQAQEDPVSLSEALTRGRLVLELRPRYNRITESDKPLRTEGFTMRTVAGWHSAPWQGLRAVAEAIHSDRIGAKDFNDDVTRSGSSPYPLLPDPRYTGANQLFIEYAVAEATRIRAGRQIIRLDNLRFISDNDFRQTPLTFTGVTAVHTGIENTELMAGYLTRVRTATGGYNSLRLTLLHAAWNPTPGHSLAAYAYLHDQTQTSNNTGLPSNANRVTGVRAEGAFPVGAIEIPYIADWATQQAYASGDSRIDANYRRIGAGVAGPTWVLRYDDELKGSNRGLYGLQTPFTDLYAHNGWALQFTTTPRQGLRDRWATLRWVVSQVTFYAEAHRYATDYGGRKIGRESNLSVSYPLLDNALLRIQHARYRPDNGPVAEDRVNKTWVTLIYSY